MSSKKESEIEQEKNDANKKDRRVKKTRLPKKKDTDFTINGSYTQQMCPVEDISYGIVKIKKSFGGGYVGIVEIEPINFLLYTPQQRADVIAEFESWLKICPVNIQLHMATTKTDVTGLIDYIMTQTKDEKDPKVLHRRDMYIKKIKDLSKVECISKRFYIVYRYEGKNGYSNDLNDILDEMLTTRGYIQTFFERMGNHVVTHKNENLFLASLLFTELNPYSSIDETVQERIGRINVDYTTYFATLGQTYDINSIPVADYLSPRGIISEKPNYMVYDGMYVSHLYIKPHGGYRHTVDSTWIENFTQNGRDVSVDIIAKRLDHNKSIENAARTIRVKRSEAHDAGTSEDDEEVLMSKIDNAAYIKKSLTDNHEDLFEVAIMMTIKARSKAALLKRQKSIVDNLHSRGYEMADCYNRNEEAFYATLPLLMVDPKLFGKMKRNMLSSSLASTYFFTAFELYDEKGIMLGKNFNNSLAVVDLFNTKRYSNANAVITGSSGMGKTYLLLLIGYALRSSGIPVHYILPFKGHEYYGACTAMGGEFIKLAPGAPTCINIMAIRPQVKADADLIDIDDDFMSESLLSKKVHQIITFIQLLKPKEEMTDAEETLLNVHITALYERFGITDDNESIWADKRTRTLKTMPIIGDLYDECMKDEVLRERVAVSMLPFVNGTCRNMNGQTNVNLDNKYIIYDVSNAGKQFLPAFAFIAVDCAYDALKVDVTSNGAIIMDEVWKMMINTYCAEFVMEIYKIIRGYGGAAICATQDIEDFFSYGDGIYGKKIISNAKIKFVLGAERTALDMISDTIGLTESEVKALEKYDRGQALMVANGEKIPISIIGTEEETRLFTTDASIKRKLAEEERQRAEALKKSQLQQARRTL